MNFNLIVILKVTLILRELKEDMCHPYSITIPIHAIKLSYYVYLVNMRQKSHPAACVRSDQFETYIVLFD
jgi:hypothetical protein